MIGKKVTYYLAQEGKNYFPFWFDEVLKETKKQTGFLSLRFEQADRAADPIAYLEFENQELFHIWIDKNSHDLLVKKIESYLIKAPKAENY